MISCFQKLFFRINLLIKHQYKKLRKFCTLGQNKKILCFHLPTRVKNFFLRCKQQYFFKYLVKFFISFIIFLKFISCFSFRIRNKERQIGNTPFCHVNQQSLLATFHSGISNFIANPTFNCIKFSK